MGLLEMAHEGTLFLDEIGEMPVKLQSRLIRVLQERVVRRVGGEKNIPINARIISATNRDLYKEIENGNFREDLYYRINVLNINIPSIADRKDDIKEIAIDLINKISSKQIKEIMMPEICFEELKKYDWPGNVRELYNFIERLLAISETDVIEKQVFDEVFLETLRLNNSEKQTRVNNTEIKEDNILVPIGTMKEMEGHIIKNIYDKYNGNKKEVARTLNISTTTLWRRFQQFQKEI
jgi:transcriptional regulator with PAS, ATPase and Fis domain